MIKNNVKGNIYYFPFICSHMVPAKMTSEPQDLQNSLQAPQNWSPSLSDVTKPPAILSPRPAFWSPLVLFKIYWLNQTNIKIYLFIVDSVIV